MIEILRRLLMVGGLCAFIGLAMYTPEALLRVHPVDFGAEFAASGHAQLFPHAAGALIVDRPSSLAAFIEAETENRLIKVSGREWRSFLYEVRQAIAGETSSAFADQVRGKDVFFTPGDASLASLLPELQRIRARGGWLNAYVAVDSLTGEEFFEMILVTDPRDSKAPSQLVYPLRRAAWWPLLAAGLGFAMLPWPRRSLRTVCYDRLSAIVGLDLIGGFVLALFVWLPLRLSATTLEALGEEFALTVFFWALAATAVPVFVWAARNAAFSIEVEPNRLVVSSLRGRNEWMLSEILAVEPLMAGGLRSGVVLRAAGDRELRLDWTELQRFVLVLDALKTAAR